MRRIFWRHRWMLLVLTVLPVLALAPYLLTRPVTYAATASVQAQSAEPQADTQVTAILSQVTAVATSPSLVQAALRTTGVSASALTVSRHDITVSSLGTSAVVTLTVTNPDPQAAIQLGRAIANLVVAKLNGLGTQTSQELTSLNSQRGQLNAAKQKLLKQLADTRLPGTSAPVQSLIAQLNTVGNQLTANAAAVQQVLASSTVNEGAGVISAPEYAISQSRHVASYCALAALLGLVIGLLIATIRELSRPTLADPGTAARELSLVLLGDAEVSKHGEVSANLELATRLDLSAHRLGARTLVLTGPVPAAQLTGLAACLNRSLQLAAGAPDDEFASRGGTRVPGIASLTAHVPGGEARTPSGALSSVSPHLLASSPRGDLRVAALPDMTLRARPEEPALVLVLARFSPRATLDEAVDLGVTTGWPLLGVIGMQRIKSARRSATPRVLTLGSGAPAQPGEEEEAADGYVADADIGADDGGPSDEAVANGVMADGERTHLGATL